MTPVTLIDAGPLVAFLSASDRHHQWASDGFDAVRGRLVSCEAVVSEASFLVARDGHRRPVILELIERMGIELQPLGPELRALRHLMDKYASVPMSFADACLVRLSELHSSSVVMTCDADFHTYRRSSRRIVNTLMPR